MCWCESSACLGNMEAGIVKTYEVLIAGKWERVQGRVFRRWLDWKSKDGSNGLTRPGKWREITEKKGQQ